MTIPSIKEQVDATLGKTSLQFNQGQVAASIISQFLLVREGLNGRVPDNELTATAATLTAGIWASNEP